MLYFKLDKENTNIYKALTVMHGIMIAFLFVVTAAMVVRYYLFFAKKKY
jgi:uncharacterized membrane protein (DUF485 family)